MLSNLGIIILNDVESAFWGLEVAKSSLKIILSIYFLSLVCDSGWRCCLINRDRKMPTDYIRNGVLYVTEK